MGERMGDGRQNIGKLDHPYKQRPQRQSTFLDGNGQDLYSMFGFQQNQQTLQEAFNFKQFSFDKVPERENTLKHVNIQNGKVWAMTAKREEIARADLNKVGRQPDLIDQLQLYARKKNTKKMYVDREGVHCLLVYDYELFYINFYGNQVHKVSSLSQEDGQMGDQNFLTGSRPSPIVAIDVHHDPGELNLFEIILGTQDGRIFHAVLEYQNNRLEIIENFACVVELPEHRAILDLKIASFESQQFMILAITESSLYQFSGEGVIRGVLEEYKSNPQLISRNMLTLEVSMSGFDDHRRNSESDDTYQAKPVSLQIFYDHKEKVKDAKPLGFGWYHELKFCFANFQFQVKVDDYNNEE